MYAGRLKRRMAYIAHRDFAPVDAWEDDAVLRAAQRKAAAE
jgi:ectoine hydroxylase